MDADVVAVLNQAGNKALQDPELRPVMLRSVLPCTAAPGSVQAAHPGRNQTLAGDHHRDQRQARITKDSHLSSTKRPASRADEITQELVRMIQLADARRIAKLPTEMELAAQLGISRPVIRESLSRLESLNMVTRRQGSGLYIVAPEKRSPKRWCCWSNRRRCRYAPSPKRCRCARSWNWKPAAWPRSTTGKWTWTGWRPKSSGWRPPARKGPGGRRGRRGVPPGAVGRGRQRHPEPGAGSVPAPVMAPARRVFLAAQAG